MERAVAQGGAQTPPCPECKSIRVVPLRRDAAWARFQCDGSDCGHVFQVQARDCPETTGAPTPPPPSTPRARLRPHEYCDKGCGTAFRWPPAKRAHEITCDGPRKETGAAEAQEEEIVASKNLACGKCGREFVHPKRLENHVKGCEGKTSAASPRAIAASKRFQEGRKGPKGVEASDRLIDGAAGAIEKALQDLRAKREDLLASIPELQDLDKAIASLEAISGPPAAAEAQA